MTDQTEIAHLMQKIAKIEEVFIEIRDHPETPFKIQAIADFGQGRVESLRVSATGFFQKARS
jgi:hypothetical protein